MKLMNVMGLSTQFLLHIGMDGPNVNLKFQRNILTAVSNAENPSEILEIGTCTLHPVSTAFKKGLQKLSFSFDSFFNNVLQAVIRLDCWDGCPICPEIYVHALALHKICWSSGVQALKQWPI
jgi:hypothetical protein